MGDCEFSRFAMGLYGVWLRWRLGMLMPCITQSTGEC